MQGKHTTVSSKVIETLAKYDSPSICNVVELFRVRPNNAGYMNASIRAIYPKTPTVVGYATTATFRSNYPAVELDAYRRIPDHLEMMQQVPAPRIVVVQDLDEPPAAAVLGEVMTTLYSSFGCVGFITNGAVRDLEQVENLHFPLWASSVIVAHGYPHFEELHTPVHVGSLTVHPGDLLHADANGVVSIPLDIAAEVAEACEEFVSAEREIMDFVAGGNVSPDDFRAAWERTAVRLNTLAESVRKAATQA